MSNRTMTGVPQSPGEGPVLCIPFRPHSVPRSEVAGTCPFIPASPPNSLATSIVRSRGIQGKRSRALGEVSVGRDYRPLVASNCWSIERLGIFPVRLSTRGPRLLEGRHFEAEI